MCTSPPPCLIWPPLVFIIIWLGTGRVLLGVGKEYGANLEVEGCLSEMRTQWLQCSSERGIIRLENAAMPAERCSLHSHSHQPPRSPCAAPTLISCKGDQLRLAKRIHVICTSFSLTPSAKSRNSCPECPEHTSTTLSSFVGLLYQTGLILLVFVLPLHSQTLLCPCPVPRQGPQLCPSLAAYIYPESPQASAMCSDSRIGQTGT